MAKEENISYIFVGDIFVGISSNPCLSKNGIILNTVTVICEGDTFKRQSHL